MNESVLIEKALYLPAVDIAALLRGQLIAVIPRVPVQKGWVFALYPYFDLEQNGVLAQVYRSHVLPFTQTVPVQQGKPAAIAAWAKCEQLKMLHEVEQVKALSNLTIWTKDWLRQTLEQRQHLFLAFLRVYRLAEPVEVNSNVVNAEKFGKFVGFSAFGEQFPSSLKVTENLPVLSHATFNQRKQQLDELRSPLHPELEELQSAIAQLSDPAARELDFKIRRFLGWTQDSIRQPNPDLAWIKTINELGTATTGGNFEKGTAFERVVHRSLTFLGFELDTNAKGGAGGMDLYCTKPYPLVGECKAGQGIPGNTVYELDKLGCIHLGKNIFDTANKLIIGPGKPTAQLQLSAKEFNISILHPMTLQKLVALQARYPNSINLFDLKNYLLPGQIDYKVDEYVDKVLKELKVRSGVVEAVKKLTETEPDDGKQFEVSEIRVKYNSLVSDSSACIDNQTMYELLLELSSPLTGYLGRLKVTSLKTDRFYFLCDLPVDPTLTE